MCSAASLVGWLLRTRRDRQPPVDVNNKMVERDWACGSFHWVTSGQSWILWAGEYAIIAPAIGQSYFKDLYKGVGVGFSLRACVDRCSQVLPLASECSAA